jgi:hypothetical protein
MAYTTIDKGSSYFNTVLYTGNGSSPRSLTGVGFSPDFVWVKSRSDTYSNSLFNSVTGGSNYLMTDSTSAQQPNFGVINSFDSDGFTVATGSSSILHVNGSASTYVAWNWRGSDSSSVSNTSGTITSTVSANTTSGFSIVSYTGNGTGGATIGHGLGVVPKMMIVKCRSAGNAWRIYHASLGNTQGMAFDTAVPTVSAIFWNNTSPTSTLFTVGTGATVNTSTATYIAYCFAEVKGFSKFGSYTGNGSTDGTFVYTGFKPAMVLMKQSSASGESWILTDNKRSTFNAVNARLFPNNTNVEATDSRPIDYLSNGFKMRTADAQMNTSAATYIYMAFAENPFVSSKGIPTTAR